MPSSAFHRQLISAMFMALLLLLRTSEATGLHHNHLRSWMPIYSRNNNELGLTCKGNAGKCVNDVEEEEDGELYSSSFLNIGDSELKRRILTTIQYISYSALTANSVPCSISGASYYNCRPGAEANPYERSCTAVTQCRS